MSKTTVLHIIKLVYHSFLLFMTGVFFAVRRAIPKWLSCTIWAVFMTEMVRRLFPLRTESIGCQKQFAHTFRPARREVPKLPHRRALAVAVLWIAVSAVIGYAYFRGLIPAGGLMLFSLFFSVCDMICVLVFYPFQKWFMKNRCCITCRIYDWDYAMMFAPLAFLPSVLPRSLSGLGLVLLARWEWTVFRHPERFSEATNASVSCKNCTEKLCRHKLL